jgi:hypothetical protein
MLHHPTVVCPASDLANDGQRGAVSCDLVSNFAVVGVIGPGETSSEISDEVVNEVDGAS